MVTCLKRFNINAHFLAAAMLIVFGSAAGWGSNGNQIGIVAVDEIVVQSEPSEYGLEQKLLQRGTEIEIINRRQGWLKIHHNGEIGFIRDQTSFVKMVKRKNKETDKEHAKQPDEQQSQIDLIKKRKEHIGLEIEKGRQEVEAFTRKENNIIKRLNRVELSLNRSRKRIATLKDEIKELGRVITEASNESEELRKRIQANEDYVARRMVALYKMNWLGKFHLLASAESMHEFIHRKAALESILAYDEKIRRDLVKNQAELKNVLDRLQVHKSQKSTRAAEYKKQIRLRSQERSMRTKLLADIRSQKALELAAIDALTQAANELDRKIKSLNTKMNGASK